MRARVRALAELLVRFGANVQPGQIVGVLTEPGKEELSRAVAEVAYEQGARFVDPWTFDPHIKRARLRHADPETLGFVPDWYGQRVLALGAAGAAQIALHGPAEPGLLDDVPPELLARDLLPRLRENRTNLAERSTNWTIGPCPTPGWAALVFPDLLPEEALERLWLDVEHICRLDEPDPVAAWRERLDTLVAISRRLQALELDEVGLEGPGTSLRIGLLPGSRWTAARLRTAGGIGHVPNLPTEEVFTTPDPERVDGHVRSTRPLVLQGTVIPELEVRFEAGRVVDVGGSPEAAAFAAVAARDEGAGRLGEVALVDGQSRISRLGRTFYTTLLDENAASHIAVGNGLDFAVEEGDRARINRSEVHIDFMVGSDEVEVHGRTREGRELTLLRGGRWEI